MDKDNETFFFLLFYASLFRPDKHDGKPVFSGGIESYIPTSCPRYKNYPLIRTIQSQVLYFNSQKHPNYAHHLISIHWLTSFFENVVNNGSYNAKRKNNKAKDRYRKQHNNKKQWMQQKKSNPCPFQISQVEAASVLGQVQIRRCIQELRGDRPSVPPVTTRGKVRYAGTRVSEGYLVQRSDVQG